MKQCEFTDCLHYCPESLSKCDEHADVECCTVRKQWKRQMLEAENTEFEYGHNVEHKTMEDIW